MKIALIGASGFVGRGILAESLDRDHDVTAIVNETSALPNADRLRGVQADATEPTVLAAAVAGHDLVISAFNPGRDPNGTGTQAIIDGGAPVKIVWNQGLYSIEGWSIPKGCPRADAARRFVGFCVDARRQAVFTETLSYGPTNLEAYKYIPAARDASLPTSPDNLKRMTIARESWWSVNRAAMTERFNTWILD